jgi:hypothetical protein
MLRSDMSDEQLRDLLFDSRITDPTRQTVEALQELVIAAHRLRWALQYELDQMHPYTPTQSRK